MFNTNRIIKGTIITMSSLLLIACSKGNEEQIDKSRDIAEDNVEQVRVVPRVHDQEYWDKHYSILYDDEKLIQLADAKSETEDVELAQVVEQPDEEIPSVEIPIDNGKTTVKEVVKETTPTSAPKQDTVKSNPTPEAPKPKTPAPAPKKDIPKKEETPEVIVEKPIQSAPAPSPEVVQKEAQQEVQKEQPKDDTVADVDVPAKPIESRIAPVLRATKEEAYNLARKSMGDNSGKMSQEYVDWSYPYRNLTKEEIQTLYGQLDMYLLNQEFQKHISQFRAEHGLGHLIIYLDFKDSTTQVSKELADYGFIAEEGQKPHTRPNPHTGKSFRTVYEENQNSHRGVGENASFLYTYANPYKLVSEKYLAEHLFNGWKNSPGHRQNMLNENYTGFYLSLYPVMNGNTKRGTKNADGQYVGLEPVGEHTGIGIMANKALIRR